MGKRFKRIHVRQREGDIGASTGELEAGRCRVTLAEMTKRE